MATLCYNIGEVGPAGGIIFALPFTGINQTKFYYEISLDDIEAPGTATLDNGDGVIPPVSVPALTTVGTEFGAYKQNVITSPAFGDGKKNTDILDALPILANSNPTIPARDLAATQCKQHGVTGPDGKDYADWFLPSKEEIEEAYIAVGAANLNLGGATVKPRWTSTGSLSSLFSATIAILVDQATPVVAPTFNPQADRSIPYGVRPIRRFVCKDKGLTYDYRLSTYYNSPGSVRSNGQIVQPDPVTFQTSIDKVYIYQDQNMVMPNGSSLYQQNCVVLAFDSNNMTGNFPGTFPPWANNLPPQFASPSPAYLPQGSPQSNYTAPALSFGPNLNTATGLGPVQYCWCPRLIVNQQTSGPDDLPPVMYRLFDQSNGTLIGTPNNPATFSKLSALIGDNVDTLLFFPNGLTAGTISPGSQFGLFPNLLNPQVDHNWDIEIIHPDYDPFELPTPNSPFQVGLKTVHLVVNRYDTRGNNMRGTFEHNFNNIQYKNFTIKIYDNFETLLGHWTYRLINDNPPGTCGADQCYMRIAFKRVQTNFVLNPDPFNPNVIDVDSIQGKSAMPGGTANGHGYMVLQMEDNIQNNSFWNGTSTRGNTLNLVDWLGTGINQRVTDPNNLPSNWLTNIPNIGNRLAWGIICGPCGPYYSTGYGQNNQCFNVMLKEYLAEVEYDTIIDNCHVYNGPYTVFYPFAGSAGDQGYQDALNAGCGGNNRVQITSSSETYDSSINECFEDPLSSMENADGIDIHIGFEQHEQTARQKFANKTDIETGPFGVGGYYPLYDTKEAAAVNSPTFYVSRDGENTYGYHIHKFGKTEYYMPNGLEMGVTQFHGDWDGTEIAEYSSTLQPLQTQQTQVVIQEGEEQEEVPQEQPSTVIITPQQTPPPTSTSTSSGGGGSGGGY